MKYIPLVAIGLFITCNTFCQIDDESLKLQYDTTKYEGHVVLRDKTILTGDLVLNDVDRSIIFSNASGQRTFNAKSISSFDYFDQNTGAKRLFYALEFNDKEAGMTSVDFFEVLKEFKSFAVLLRTQSPEMKTKPAYAYRPTDLASGQTTPFIPNDRVIVRSRTIYFVDDNGNFEPYSRLTQKENLDRLIMRNTADSDILNSDLIEKYTSPHYAHLKKFAKERKLRFTKQDDLVAILNEYEAVLEDEEMK